MTQFKFMEQYATRSSPKGVPLCGDVAMLSGWNEKANPWEINTAEGRAWLADWYYTEAECFIDHIGWPKGQTLEQIKAERDLLLLSQKALLEHRKKLEQQIRDMRESRGKEVARLQTKIDKLNEELQSALSRPAVLYRGANGESPF